MIVVLIALPIALIAVAFFIWVGGKLAGLSFREAFRDLTS